MTSPSGSPLGDADLPGQLARAEEQEAQLRRELAELVTRSRTATAEAERLRARARLDGADPRVGEAAERYAAEAAHTATEIESARRAVRAAEGEVVALRAQLETGA